MSGMPATTLPKTSNVDDRSRDSQAVGRLPRRVQSASRAVLPDPAGGADQGQSRHEPLIQPVPSRGRALSWRHADDGTVGEA